MSSLGKQLRNKLSSPQMYWLNTNSAQWLGILCTACRKTEELFKIRHFLKVENHLQDLECVCVASVSVVLWFGSTD